MTRARRGPHSLPGADECPSRSHRVSRWRRIRSKQSVTSPNRSAASAINGGDDRRRAMATARCMPPWLVVLAGAHRASRVRAQRPRSSASGSAASSTTAVAPILRDGLSYPSSPSLRPARSAYRRLGRRHRPRFVEMMRELTHETSASWPTGLSICQGAMQRDAARRRQLFVVVSRTSACENRCRPACRHACVRSRSRAASATEQRSPQLAEPAPRRCRRRGDHRRRRHHRARAAPARHRGGCAGTPARSATRRRRNPLSPLCAADSGTRRRRTGCLVSRWIARTTASGPACPAATENRPLRLFSPQTNGPCAARHLRGAPPPPALAASTSRSTMTSMRVPQLVRTNSSRRSDFRSPSRSSAHHSARCSPQGEKVGGVVEQRSARLCIQ